MQGKLSSLEVGPESHVAEISVQSLLLGMILAVVMAAANAYLGLYAGMTVSASIPAAVVSMGILRGLLRRGTILENNIVQTAASTGEAVAAGVIFTIPALVITGVWKGFHYWPVTVLAILGGALGSIFMIPMRRTLIVEEKGLVYPEGVACARVLEAGEKRGSGVTYVASGFGLGALFKFLVGGLGVVKGTVEGAWRLGQTVVYLGADMSVALLGVGAIVGFNIAVLVFLGGALSWLITLPVWGATHVLPNAAPLEAVWAIWKTQVRYLGVGAMAIGGIWSIIKMRAGISKGFREAVFGYRVERAAGNERRPRTDQDLPVRQIALALGLTVMGTFAFYIVTTGSVGIGLFSGVIMLVTGFFFVAVSSYIVGLVGSSNNPVSGMTICTILLASGLLLLLGMRGKEGILAALAVGGVVCCAACGAGDMSQDLKTGFLVGATPRRQQITQLISVVLSALVVAPILALLYRAYGIGVPTPDHPTPLKAPQASLFAALTQAIFTKEGSLPWEMVFLGIGVGLCLIVIGEILRVRNARFRVHVMPVAVGLYLPLTLSVPILLGGLVSLCQRTQAGADREAKRGQGAGSSSPPGSSPGNR